jgi:hypothetical protein
MADGLLVEVIKILGSAVVGGGATYFWKHILPERRRQRDLVERLESELLSAAHDLQKRLYNFIELKGWVYIGAQERQKDLVPSTLYRVGQYLAYSEIWRRHRGVLRKVHPKKADDVFSKMGEISKGFSSDRDFSSQKLRLFTDDQGIFGESLIQRK